MSRVWVKRLLASSGCFRGVDVPDSLLDDADGLAGLPYVQYFYSYFPAGYSLTRRTHGIEPSAKRPPFVGPPRPRSEAHILHEAVHDRLLRHKLTVRGLPGGYT